MTSSCGDKLEGEGVGEREAASLARVLSLIETIPADRRDHDSEFISVGALRLLARAARTPQMRDSNG